MNFFKSKETFGKCYLCNRPLDNNYASLSFTTDDLEEIEYGRICSSCADILDAKEKASTITDNIEIEEDDDQSV